MAALAAAREAYLHARGVKVRNCRHWLFPHTPARLPPPSHTPLTLVAHISHTFLTFAPARSHVVIADVREELVVYVDGTPYIRRELEMPAAAMHHAGIHAAQLQARRAAIAAAASRELASCARRAWRDMQCQLCQG